MSMTKKDFEAIANVIQHEVNVAKSDGRHPLDVERIGVCRVIASRIAEYCSTRNKAFDRKRFLKACGLRFD